MSRYRDFFYEGNFYLNANIFSLLYCPYQIYTNVVNKGRLYKKYKKHFIDKIVYGTSLHKIIKIAIKRFLEGYADNYINYETINNVVNEVVKSGYEKKEGFELDSITINSIKQSLYNKLIDQSILNNLMYNIETYKSLYGQENIHAEREYVYETNLKGHENKVFMYLKPDIVIETPNNRILVIELKHYKYKLEPLIRVQLYYYIYALKKLYGENSVIITQVYNLNNGLFVDSLFIKSSNTPQIEQEVEVYINLLLEFYLRKGYCISDEIPVITNKEDIDFIKKVLVASGELGIDASTLCMLCDIKDYCNIINSKKNDESNFVTLRNLLSERVNEVLGYIETGQY